MPNRDSFSSHGWFIICFFTSKCPANIKNTRPYICNNKNIDGLYAVRNFGEQQDVINTKINNYVP